MNVRTPVTRAVASIILAAAVLTGTAGCTFFATQATLIQYDPSNGVGANIGDVQVRNAIALISDDGRAVSLLVTLVNSGRKDVSITLQYESGGEKRTDLKAVAGGEAASFGNVVGEDQIVVLNPGVEAGALFPVYVQYEDFEGKQLMVPVLEATGTYEELKPEDGLR